MSRYVLVVVGTSYGGLQAMSTLLDGIPVDFGAAIAFVQHRSKDSDETLVRVLQEHSVLPVREAEDKMPIRTGRVYVAPPDYHLLVDAEFFALSTEAPVGYSRPSIDVFLESAAEAFGSRVIGVVLTGANADGARGLRAVKAAGGYAIAQDPDTALSPAMPRAAIEAVAVDDVLPLERIAGRLLQILADAPAPARGRS